jgi:hypothetical protein
MELIKQLEETRDQTLSFYALDADALARTYAPGKWSVKFLLHHLADAETILFDRVRRILSEPRQVLWAFDQDAFASGLDYDTLPLELSRNIYQSVRAGMMHYAHLYYVRDGDREFVHSKTGVRTLRDEFDKVAAHNAHHLAQIRAALARR